ncbi:MAG: hypothetical protein JRE14_13125 [Deltaproteobacteria bacterium]|nr:hypothetical protein [Deltaproteobacteria bacterium]
MFARPETCPFCYRYNANADGAISFFAFAGAVFAARSIVVIPAGCMAGVKIIVRPSEGIGRPKRVKKPTAWPKIVVGMV